MMAPNRGKRYGPGHGLEKAPFHTLQRENRQVGGNNNRDRIKDWALDFMSRVEYLLFGCAVVRIGAAQVSNDVFDHNYRAIHDHPEIQRS